MIDRSDIIIEVPEVSGQLLFLTKPAEASSTIAARIAKAAGFAESHNGLMDDIGENDRLTWRWILANACRWTLRSCCDSQWKNDSSQPGAFTRLSAWRG